MAAWLGGFGGKGRRSVLTRSAAGLDGRADWAGKLVMEDGSVLDSPIGNAIAHYVMNMLFWNGGGDGGGPSNAPAPSLSVVTQAVARAR